MADSSARLNLPYLLPAQAQKHVTHNEAVLLLDALVQTGVTMFGVNDPPANPEVGALFEVGSAPTGAWAGKAGSLALHTENGWQFIAPRVGWRAWDMETSRLMVHDASGWRSVEPETTNLDGIGIGTDWDSVNRLSVASEASLLSHNGAGHQLKINKAQTADTASLLFQSNWTGHAEMGLAGEDAFSIKVSPDGSSWTEALSFDPATGAASGAAVQASPTDATPGVLMRADWGYGPGTVLGPVSQTAGVPTGALIEQGSTANGDYARWADGTQLCWTDDVITGAVSDSVGSCFAIPAPVTWTFPVPFVSMPIITASVKDHFFSWATQANLTNASVQFMRISPYAANSTRAINALAVGRWF